MSLEREHRRLLQALRGAADTTTGEPEPMTIRTYQAVQAGLAARAASSGTDVAAVASAGGDGRPRRAA